MIAPTPLLTTFTLTSSTSIFSSEFFTASLDPWTSALIKTLISFNPSPILENKSSKLTASVVLFSRSLACVFLCSPIFLACFSLSKAINLSPAIGVSFRPVISTGLDGRAVVISSPLSFFKVLTFP